MACACKGRRSQKYLWTGTVNGETVTQEYSTELEAKAKVLRKGGSYKPVEPAQG